jgi:hypothetical protein
MSDTVAYSFTAFQEVAQRVPNPAKARSARVERHRLGRDLTLEVQAMGPAPLGHPVSHLLVSTLRPSHTSCRVTPEGDQ